LWAYAFDIEEGYARRFAEDLSKDTGIDVIAVSDLAKAVEESDICVTCTPSKKYFLNREYVRAGTFIAAVGADYPEKQEKEGRTSDEEIIVFDSTGTALQDVAAAAVVYERAMSAGMGIVLNLGE
jgi:ornithine cyclodeaminase/alanine dehydrogenase-like protein (mu-crystallin family)